MTRQPRSQSPPKVLIAGGGVGAVEAALALRELAGERVEVEICAPQRQFVYRPFAVGQPFGRASVLRFDLTRLAERCGARFRASGVVAVDPDRRLVTVRDGESVPYDYLLLATGARMLWAVPGAVTFWGAADEGGVDAVVRNLRAGRLRDVVFTMPAGSTWGLPLYELALLAAAVLARSGIENARLAIATPEDAPLGLFGRSVGERMTRLLDERRIECVTGVHPVEFYGGFLRIVPGEPIETEAVVSLPRLEGRRIDGVPHDEAGFVAVDRHCRVVGMERVFAAGDVTSFPIKQGGIAAQQADAAAEAIAAAAGAEVEPAPFDPVLESPPWGSPDGKIPSRYLSPFLDGIAGEDGSAPIFRDRWPSDVPGVRHQSGR